MTDLNRFREETKQWLDDQEIVFSLFDWIQEKNCINDKVGKTILMVLTSNGIFGNGGLRSFFESDFEDGTSHKDFIKAYKYIGAIQTAGIIEKTLVLFPGNVPQQDLSKRNLFLANNFVEETNPKFAVLENALFEQLDGDFIKLLNYIKGNKEHFLKQEKSIEQR